MKKRLCFVCFLFGAVILAACGEGKEILEDSNVVPYESENVMTPQESPEEQSLERTVDLETLFAEYEEALAAEYENFLMPEKITIEGSRPCVMVEAVVPSDYDKYADEMAQTVLGDLLPEQYELVEIPTGALVYDDEDNKLYFSIDKSGFVSFEKSVGYKIRLSNDYDVVDIVHVDRGDSLDASYVLEDGEESLQDAVRYVENWFHENWTAFESDFTFRVKTIEIRQNGDKYFYSMTVEKFFNGVPLENIFTLGGNSDENGRVKYIPAIITLRMFNCDSIDVFTNSTTMLEIRETEEAEDGWLSLKDCMRMLEQLFAEYQVYEISDIEIKYVISPDYASLDPSITNPGYAMPGMHMKLRPVWSLIIDIPREKLLNANGSFTAGDERFYINVDMRTGEVWFDVG